MTDEPLRHGTCDICGETADLFINDEVLPEEFEGVGCAACIEYHEQAQIVKDELDRATRDDTDDFWEEIM